MHALVHGDSTTSNYSVNSQDGRYQQQLPRGMVQLRRRSRHELVFCLIRSWWLTYTKEINGDTDLGPLRIDKVLQDCLCCIDNQMFNREIHLKAPEYCVNLAQIMTAYGKC